MNTGTILQLQNSLTEFGLNPMDWNINKIERNYAWIQHRSEDDLQMIGWIDLENQQTSQEQKNRASCLIKKLEMLSLF